MAQVSIDNGSFDPDGDEIGITQFPPGPYPVGVTLVHLNVIDTRGLTATCMASVTVLDVTPPTVLCLADITHNSDLNQCGAVVTFPLPSASDLCSPVTNITCTPASGSFFP